MGSNENGQLCIGEQLKFLNRFENLDRLKTHFITKVTIK
jgi:hypothetical protein